MSDKPLVSLCMPTNGVIEWVFPVLDSIFKQSVDHELFEVVVTDNGNSQEFKKKIREYAANYSNLLYAETEALPFLNEIESYKLAKGQLIKFVNHRTLLVEGALQRLIDFVSDNISEKPIAYFANGVLELPKERCEFDNFDMFVRYLSYWSSWSTGMAIWKDDFVNLPRDISTFNELFPHTTVLFNDRNRNKYVIDNSTIMDEIPPGNRPKGNYDLFGAFAIEYPDIICGLLKDGSISIETYKHVLDQNLSFVIRMYWDYCVRKEVCSYDLSGLKQVWGIYYTKLDFFKKIISLMVEKVTSRIIRNFDERVKI